jgi:hypothetical protein
MRLVKLLAALLVAGLLASSCKKDQESLIVVALTADAAAGSLTTLTLSAQSPTSGGGAQTFAINGLGTTAVSYGLYIPGDLLGDVTVNATASGGGSCYAGRTTPAVRVTAAGSVVQAAIAMKASPCGGGGSSGQAGSGGSTGTGGSTCAGPPSGAGVPPTLTSCNEYYLHASSSCTIGSSDDFTVASVAFSPNGQYLVTAASGQAKVWTFSGNTPVDAGHTLTGPGFPVVAFSSDGSLLAVGWQGIVEVWKVSSWTRQQTLTLAASTNASYDVAFAPDGQHVISIDTNTSTGIGNLYLFSTTASASLQKVTITLPWALAVSPVASGTGSLAAVSDQSGQVSVYTVATTGISSPTVLTATSGVSAYGVRFSPDGTMLAAAAGVDGLVHFWNVPLSSTASVAPDIDVYAGSSGWSDDAYAVDFSPNGNFVVVGAGFFGSLSSWTAGSSRCMFDINENPLYDIASVAVSPTGTRIAAGENDCGLVVICGSN